ncbi:MAG: sterol desaturase family protein, partial [Pseudomonadota bacterium]
MQNIIESHETLIRLGFFFGMLAAMGIWETFLPRRPLAVSRALRWLNNLGLVVLNSVLLRLVFPAAAVGMAAVAADRGWGLLNQLDVPPGLATVVAVIALDFAIWLQHVVFHAIPVLWRLHRVHHADLDYDVTTGLRFHPIEILLSMLIKFAVIMVLGPPIVGVILFEVILNAGAMFNHGNVGLPPALDKVLRWFIVT